ncbi:MAG: hypothetical protein V2A58_11320 [Planctomycetota bacterium]
MEKHRDRTWRGEVISTPGEDGEVRVITFHRNTFGIKLADVYGESREERERSADRIVRACNAHEELGDALEAARHELAICAEVFAALGDPEHCLHADTRHGYDWAELRKTCRDCETDALAALAKAKGERE